jgi:hypothetical protein
VKSGDLINDFNFDYQVSFTAGDEKQNKAYYNVDFKMNCFGVVSAFS